MVLSVGACGSVCQEVAIPLVRKKLGALKVRILSDDATNIFDSHEYHSLTKSS